MPVIDLTRFCRNGTVIFRLAKTIDYNETSQTIEVVARSKIRDSDQRAVLYIVVVLIFYSCGIIIGIVMYLKRERAEMEEERAYEDYLIFKSDPARMTRHFCKQQYATRLRKMEEDQKIRQKANMEKDKPRMTKKRHSHGNFHFLSSSKHTSPVTTPTSTKSHKLVSPAIVIDNFDDLVERGAIIRDIDRRRSSTSRESYDALLPDSSQSRCSQIPPKSVKVHYVVATSQSWSPPSSEKSYVSKPRFSSQDSDRREVFAFKQRSRSPSPEMQELMSSHESAVICAQTQRSHSTSPEQDAPILFITTDEVVTSAVTKAPTPSQSGSRKSTLIVTEL